MASITAFLTSSFSFSVKLLGSFTSTGVVGFFNAGVTTSSDGMLPFGVVTLPSLFTVTWSPFNVGCPFASLLASITAFLTSSFSLSVKWLGSFTSTGVVGFFNAGVTTSSDGKLPFGVSTFPWSSTLISLSVKPGLFLIISSTTLAFSGSVSLDGLTTSTGVVGFFKVEVTTSFAGKLPFGVVTFPWSSTLISFLSNPGFALATASLTASFSLTVKLFGFSTSTSLFGLFKTVVTTSSFGRFPFGVTTFPWLSTVTSPLFKPGFSATTASLMSSFSLSVKASGFPTTTGVVGFFNAGVTTSFASNLSPFLVVTLPWSSTLISSFFRPGFASATACLTLSFSSFVKWFGSATTTGVVGLFKAWVITSSGNKNPFGVVTLPLSSTEISSSFNSGFALITASFTLDFSSSVKWFISVTLTLFSGLFNFLEYSLISVGVWTLAIACLPFIVADSTSSGVFALSIFASWAFLTSSTFCFKASFSDLVKPLSSSISFFSSSAASVKSAFALSLSVAFLTGTSISSFDPSGYVTSTTTTFLPAFAPVPSTIAPSFLTCLSFGCGCPSGTTTAFVIAFLSTSATFLSFAGSTLTGTSPDVTVGVDLSASVLCTASIAFLPSSVAFATSSGVDALSIFFSCSSLTLSTSAFLSAFCWSVKFLSASISSFSLLAASVKSALAFSLALSNAFSASVFASTVLDAGSSFCDLSE